MSRKIFVVSMLIAALFSACSNGGGSSDNSATQVQQILPTTTPADSEIKEEITTQAPGSSIDQAAPIKNP